MEIHVARCTVCHEVKIRCISLKLEQINFYVYNIRTINAMK